MLTLIPCPGRRAPAVVTGRFPLPGAGWLADHLAMRRRARHCYRMPAGLLAAGSQEQLGSQRPGPGAPCAGVVTPARATGCLGGCAHDQRRHGRAGAGI